MALTRLAVNGYRSLQNLSLPLAGLTLVTGANGSGKSNLYRALGLMVAAARGDLVAALAREGGLPAALWAGPERSSRAMQTGEVPVQGGPHQQPVRLRLGLATAELSYALELGYPPAGRTAFALDPEVKAEWIWAGGPFHPRACLVERSRGVVNLHEGDRSQTLPLDLSPFESLLSCGADPEQAPEVLRLRELVLSWRFYDGFRTDAKAPARQSSIATRTERLSGDGHDLAAALQTILEIGDIDGLQQAIGEAFPGSRVAVDTSTARFGLGFHQQGLLRPLEASELSDGTLRYLLLSAALFSPRLPPLLVLNEPENSLHPELLTPLARMVAQVAERTQVMVIAHAPELISALGAIEGSQQIHLERRLGATILPGQSAIERAAWRWPS